MDDLSLRWLAGQAVSLVALALCIAGFASKRDDRLFVLLIFANVAFALQFALFESWVAAGIAALIVVRVTLVRRYRGSVGVMLAVLAATLAVAWLTWQGPRDVPALAAGVLGTVGMFMFAGIAMRGLLAIAAFCWIVSNVWAGSVGGTLAEGLILVTNLVTMVRLARDRRRVSVRVGAKE